MIDRYLFNSGFADNQIREFLEYTYSLYYQRAIFGHKKESRLDGWLYVNPMDLITDPKKHTEEWMDVFKMKRPFDNFDLFLYNEKNKQLLFKNFGMNFETLCKSDWLDLTTKILQNVSFFYNLDDKVLR